MYSRLFIFSFSAFWGFQCTSQGPATNEASSSGDTLCLTPAQRAGMLLQVGFLRKDTVRQRVRLVGRTVILAHAQGRVHSRVEGTIEDILVREGQYVQAGQPLFRMYSAAVVDLQRAYVEAFQRTRAAYRTLVQQESLMVGSLTSAAELSRARMEYRQAQAQLQAVASQLQLMGLHPDTTGRIQLLTVRAPLSGFITRVSAALGEYVRPDKELAHIVNPSDLHADLYLSERELTWVRPGLPVRLQLPALPEIGELPSVVEYVAQVQDSGGSVLVAHVKIPPLPVRLFEGVPVHGYVEHITGTAFQVPATAVAYHGEKAYVFTVVDSSCFVPLPVRVTLIDTLALLEGEALREDLSYVQRGASFLGAALWQVAEE